MTTQTLTAADLRDTLELTPDMAVAGPTRDQHWLRVLAGVAIIWFSLNLIVFVSTMFSTPEQVAARYTEAQIAFMAALPRWSMALSGLSVAFGLVASLGLFFRREEAYLAFMLSLLMAIGHLFDVMSRGGFETLGAGDAFAPITLLLFTLFLFWASYDARRHGQLDGA